MKRVQMNELSSNHHFSHASRQLSRRCSTRIVTAKRHAKIVFYIHKKHHHLYSRSQLIYYYFQPPNSISKTATILVHKTIFVSNFSVLCCCAMTYYTA